MKRIIATFLLLALLSAFGGCQMPNKSDEPINPANGAGQTSETEANDVPREKKAPGSGKYNEGKYVYPVAPVSYNRYWNVEKTVPDYGAYPDKSDEVRTVKTSHGTVTAIPVFGEYFTKTEYTLFILFVNKKAIGIQIEKDGYDAEKITAETVNSSEKKITVQGKEIVFYEKDYFSSCYAECMKVYPDFNVLAIGYSGLYWYFTGNTGEGTDLVFYNFSDGTLTRHSMIGNAKTIAEARVNMAKTLDFRYRLGEELIIYPFADKQTNRRYYGILRELSFDKGNEYLSYSDFEFVIPVLDENLNENCYVILLTHADEIYGEIVLKHENDSSYPDFFVQSFCKIIYSNVGKKTADGYRALDSVGYLELLKANAPQVGTSTKNRIGFDGSALFVYR